MDFIEVLPQTRWGDSKGSGLNGTGLSRKAFRRLAFGLLSEVRSVAYTASVCV